MKIQFVPLILLVFLVFVNFVCNVSTRNLFVAALFTLAMLASLKFFFHFCFLSTKPYYLHFSDEVHAPFESITSIFR